MLFRSQQEEPHLFTDAFIIAGCEKYFDLVEKALTGESDAECLPCTVVGLSESLGQGLAVIGEVLLHGNDDVLRSVSHIGSEGLAKTEADQLGDERHGELPYFIKIPLPSDELFACSLFVVADLIAQKDFRWNDANRYSFPLPMIS